jgi:hypothetical protein
MGLTFTSRAVWREILDLMFLDGNCGIITATVEQLARMCVCSEVEVETFLRENDALLVADVDKSDTIITLRCRRMVREHQKRIGGAERQRQFRAKGGGDPERWSAIRVHILERDKYTCAYCGKKANTVDHIFPKSKGGDESESNLVACCKSCNQIKGNRSMQEANFSFWKDFDQLKLQNNTKMTPPSSSSSSSSSSKKEKTHSASEPAPYTDEFESFWTRYPKKVDKRKAYRTWLKAVKVCPNADLICAVTTYVADCKSTERILKDPATFLSDRDRPYLEWIEKAKEQEAKKQRTREEAKRREEYLAARQPAPAPEARPNPEGASKAREIAKQIGNKMSIGGER